MYIGLNNLGLNSQNQAFSPASLFSAGEQGGWYDPSDFSTMYQDSAGTTPVTAVEQPVGFIGDKRLGWVRGAEKAVNGGFDTDTVWTKGAGVTISGGTCQFAAAAAGVNVFENNGTWLDTTKMYELTMDIVSISGGSLRMQLEGVVGPNVSTTGPYRCILTPAAATNRLFVQVAAGTVTAVIDNVSVKELPGNHRTQTTAASRPTLSARYNQVINTENISTANWTSLGASTTTGQAAPDGSFTATKLVEDGATSVHRIRQNIAIAGSNKVRICAKAGERTKLGICDSDAGATLGVFDLSAGTATGGDAAITPHPTAAGWYICTMTPTLGTSGAFIFLLDASGTRSYAGNGTSGLYIWGADVRLSADASLAIPSYQRVNTATDYDAAGFPLYLSYDGVDDWMSTASVDFSGTDKMTMIAGVHKVSDAALGIFCEHGNTVDTLLNAPRTDGSANYGADLRGGANTSVTTGPFAAPISNVVSVLLNRAGASASDQIKLRINGVLPSQTVFNPGPATGNFTNNPFYFGRRAGTTLPFNGREYGTIIRGAATDTGTVFQGERWMGYKMGIFL